ncbi:hypothetical protein BpsM61_00013 [Bacillus phage vB_BpsM-61]|nr:hypothetical protein BpsM61_00013 [Bacillus phage vB_BpsM-61]
MGKRSNHGTDWTTSEEKKLIDTMWKVLENGGTQRHAFRILSKDVGRTWTAIEYHWKLMKKSDPMILETYKSILMSRGYQQPYQQFVENLTIINVNTHAENITKVVSDIVDSGSPKSEMIQEMYNRLSEIKPGDKGYSTASGMKSMIIQMIRIYGDDPSELINM